MEHLTDDGNIIIIPNWRHVPVKRAPREDENLEGEWKVYHSRAYLRRQKKLNEKRRQQKELK